MKHSKNILIYSLLILIMIQIGSLSYEVVRIAAGRTVGYQSYYLSKIGRLVFYSNKVHNRLSDLRKKQYPIKFIQNQKIYQNEKYWNLIEKTNRTYAFIDYSGFLFLILISSGGILWRLKRKFNVFSYKDITALLLSFFFLRNTVIFATMMFLNPSLCKEKEIMHIIDISPNLYIAIYTILSIIGVLVIFIKLVPPHIKLDFVISAFLGGSLGTILWCFLTGPGFLG